MSAAMALGGFTGPEADTLGYAIRKKKSSVLRAQKERFVTQAAERGVEPQVIDAVFKAFEPFERYGFNKAHATCYGLIAYQTAYLKANYTVEYMTSVLTAFRDIERARGGRRRRVPAPGHRGPAARRPQVGRPLHGRGRRHPLRPAGGQERRPGRHRVDRRDPRGRRRLPLAGGLLRAGRPAAGQQARPRVAGQGQRAQPLRPSRAAAARPSTTRWPPARPSSATGSAARPRSSTSAPSRR